MSNIRKAAEQALNALVDAVPCTAEQVIEQNKAIDALRAALAEPEQEPVAWRGLSDVQWMNIVNLNRAWYGFSVEDAVHEVVKLTEAKLKENNAAPPRREPLTDEQVGMLTVFPGLHHVETPVLAAFIRHIEQVITGGKT